MKPLARSDARRLCTRASDTSPAAGDDSPDIRKLFKAHYRGCRYSFGYPACPNLEDQTGLFALIDPGRVGISLTEQFLLEPEQSTTAIVVHHPQAKYFNVRRGGEADCAAG